eukprot:5621659-Alexandrium_andersonii.AAC.1
MWRVVQERAACHPVLRRDYCVVCHPCAFHPAPLKAWPRSPWCPEQPSCWAIHTAMCAVVGAQRHFVLFMVVKYVLLA